MHFANTWLGGSGAQTYFQSHAPVNQWHHHLPQDLSDTWPLSWAVLCTEAAPIDSHNCKILSLASSKDVEPANCGIQFETQVSLLKACGIPTQNGDLVGQAFLLVPNGLQLRGERGPRRSCLQAGEECVNSYHFQTGYWTLLFEVQSTHP